MNKGNSFQESLEQFGGLELSFRSFQFSNLLQSLGNQPRQNSSVSFFKKKVNKRHLKKLNVSYEKWQNLAILLF